MAHPAFVREFDMATTNIRRNEDCDVIHEQYDAFDSERYRYIIGKLRDLEKQHGLDLHVGINNSCVAAEHPSGSHITTPCFEFTLTNMLIVKRWIRERY